ncbi:hypothetical protein PIB30_078580 [Stylosanthes scabra]|uniref:Uncharacterized protein n=1 Tax=Stylosanthes scabra TaxID=79078 RepID=A0ABU6YNH5_9FABA|nr:hypothetical protein [Stylosanthes scabra]
MNLELNLFVTSERHSITPAQAIDTANLIARDELEIGRGANQSAKRDRYEIRRLGGQAGLNEEDYSVDKSVNVLGNGPLKMGHCGYFAFRGVCNRCGSARLVGAAGGGGRGKGHAGQGQESGGVSRPVTGGLFGPNDWPCSIGGRGGGYKELDEEEIEETKRRRQEAEDDGELYDEFGNLKKKFRAKTHFGAYGKELQRIDCLVDLPIVKSFKDI